MTDVYSQEVQGKPKEHQQKPWGEPRDNQMAKVEGSTSATGGFRFGISGTTVTGTVTALTVATPFIVLFSPVLVSVFVIVFLLATGFFAAREVGIAVKTGLSRCYKYVTDANRNRIQEDSFHQDTKKYGLRARETKDRDDQRMSEWGRYDETIEPEESSHNLVKAATAATTGTSLVAFSGLTFIGTVIALILATLPLAIFSPVLVPALITMLLLASGFFVSGGLSVAAVTTLGWLYKYVTNGNHRDTSLSDRESGKQGSARERMDITDFTRYTDEGAKGEEGRPGFRYTTESGNSYSQILKAVTTTTAGGSLLVFSGLTFVGTVIAVTVATPVLVIFSPVLVPALITMFLVVTGFLTSGGLGVAGMSVLSWIYKFATTENRTREDSVDQERYKFGSKGWETRDRHRDEHGIGEGYHVTNRDRVRDLVNPASHHHV